MITIRKSADRGSTKTSWLDSKHSFSFGHYDDPQYREFETLKVMNEDIIQPSTGFATHSHQNMEILSYVIKGQLEHKDSLGTGSVILPGDVQRMSAGTGILHSEFNPDQHNPVHLLQIWINPEKQNLSPSYEQKNFIQQRKTQQLTLIASQNGKENSLTIHQSVAIYVLDLNKNQHFNYNLDKDSKLWIQIVGGHIHLNQQTLEQGDGAAIVNQKMLEFVALETAEILLIEFC